MPEFLDHHSLCSKEQGSDKETSTHDEDGYCIGEEKQSYTQS